MGTQFEEIPIESTDEFSDYALQRKYNRKYNKRTRGTKRRWKDEESRTGGYSRSKYRSTGLQLANDQMEAEEELQD